MKLFTEAFRYTDEALNLESEAVRIFGEIARKYLAAGASIRDVAHILNGAVTTFECETMLGVPEGKTLQQHLSEN